MEKQENLTGIRIGYACIKESEGGNMDEILTCKDCLLRIGKCCKLGETVADFKRSNFIGSVVGINEETTEDYYRVACSQYTGK